MARRASARSPRRRAAASTDVVWRRALTFAVTDRRREMSFFWRIAVVALIAVGIALAVLARRPASGASVEAPRAARFGHGFGSASCSRASRSSGL